jgi:preprotein translocase subunit YajC
MHAFLTLLAQATPSTTAAKSSKSGGSSELPLLIIIGLFAVAYFLFIRPRQQRMRQQQTVGRQMSVGDGVVSAGGIYGTVVALDSDVVEVEVSPGVVLTFLRKAVSLRPGASSAPAEPDDDEWQVPPAISGGDPTDASGPEMPGRDAGGPDPDTRA